VIRDVKTPVSFEAEAVAVASFIGALFLMFAGAGVWVASLLH
jgi:hypothetical protein